MYYSIEGKRFFGSLELEMATQREGKLNKRWVMTRIIDCLGHEKTSE